MVGGCWMGGGVSEWMNRWLSECVGCLVVGRWVDAWEGR